ncbi:discoidin domain receptor family member 1 [Microdochium nivale]|nr:discoidin domain receptor family member 1 [Microdochium nivale]
MPFLSIEPHFSLPENFTTPGPPSVMPAEGMGTDNLSTTAFTYHLPGSPSPTTASSASPSNPTSSSINTMAAATLITTLTTLTPPPLATVTLTAFDLHNPTAAAATPTPPTARINDFKPGGNQFWIIIGILVVGVIVLLSCVITLVVCRQRQKPQVSGVRSLIPDEITSFQQGSRIISSTTETPERSSGSSATAVYESPPDSKAVTASKRSTSGGSRAEQRSTSHGDQAGEYGSEGSAPRQGKTLICDNCHEPLTQGPPPIGGVYIGGKVSGEENGRSGSALSSRIFSGSWPSTVVCRACMALESGVTDRLRCGN